MINAIIIDDQESYRIKLKRMFEKFSVKDIVVVGEAASAEEGVRLIAKTNPDLVFLDIEMPDGTGFDMLMQIGSIRFDVIFTTSHIEFGIQAIKFSALDYLVKPIQIEELQVAIEKHIEKKKHHIQQKQFEALFQNIQNFNNPTKLIGLPTPDEIIFIPLDDIVRCQASNNYTEFFLKDGTEKVVSHTLKESEKLLCQHSFFFRIHDSHIINMHYLLSYKRGDGGSVALKHSKMEPPVSRRKKEEFLARLKEMKSVF